MQFGLIYDFRNPEPWRRPFSTLYEELLEQIEYAEALGYDSVWLTEHHFVADGYTPSVLPLAAAIAARTSRIRIGTWVLLLPLHHALRVAEDAATVDIISTGRFMLGLGLGYRIEEFEAFGIPRQHRRRLMDEGVEIIKRAWTEDSFSFSGRHYQLKNVSLYPKPIQQPHPPIWLGARSSAAAERAARFDCPLLLVGGRDVYEAYAKALSACDRDPARYEVLGSKTCMVSDDPERTWMEIRDHLGWTGGLYAQWYGEAADLPTDRERIGKVVIDPDERRPQVTIGSAANCVEAIEAWRRQIPFTHLIGTATPAGIPPRQMYPYLERFAREVIPHFRAPAVPARWSGAG